MRLLKKTCRLEFHSFTVMGAGLSVIRFFICPLVTFSSMSLNTLSPSPRRAASLAYISKAMFQDSTQGQPPLHWSASKYLASRASPPLFTTSVLEPAETVMVFSVRTALEVARMATLAFSPLGSSTAKWTLLRLAKSAKVSDRKALNPVKTTLSGFAHVTGALLESTRTRLLAWVLVPEFTTRVTQITRMANPTSALKTVAPKCA